LSSKKIPSTDGERLGLCGVNERGRYDFFRDRVMLPVIDRQKRVVGFSGRLLDPEAKDRKYVNSPDSPLFHKKEQLYGLHAAIEAIRKTGVAIVVEGNFDVMSLHEAGIDSAVAPMGTALTLEQIDLLGRLARQVVVVFDGDTAGQRAADKAVPLFVEADVDGRIARLPTGVDPDDFVRQRDEGAEAFQRLVDGARPMLDHFIQTVTKGISDQGLTKRDLPNRVEALEAITRLLARARNQTTLELYARRTAAVLDMTIHQVNRALREASESLRRGPVQPAANAEAAPAPAEAPPQRKLPPEELYFLVLLVTYPELARLPQTNRAGDLLIDPSLRQLFRLAMEGIASANRIDIAAWLQAAPADVRDSVSRALMDGSINRVADPQVTLVKLGAKLELLRVEAEILMNEKLAEGARSRGDEATTRATTVRGLALTQAKLGLKAAIERP
jgi:DNA primase